MAVKSIRFTVANGNFGQLRNLHNKMTAVNSIATSNQHKLMILGVYAYKEPISAIADSVLAAILQLCN